MWRFNCNKESSSHFLLAILCLASFFFFFHFIILKVREVWEANTSPVSSLSGDWWMRQGGRGIEVNYRQQRGQGAYYFGAETCIGPMGVTFTTRAPPHPSNPHPTLIPPLHPRSTRTITHIYTKEPTVGLTGLIMKRPLTFGTGRMINCIPGSSLAASGGLQIALDN